jgi:hypothetical protein
MMIDFGLRNKGVPFEHLAAHRIAGTLENLVDVGFPDEDNFLRFLSDGGYVGGDGTLSQSRFIAACQKLKVTARGIYRAAELEEFLERIGKRA